MRLFEHTKNTRTIIDSDLRFIRSDVPTYISGEERQWMIDNNIRTVVDLREVSEQDQKPCPLKTDKEFNYISMPVKGGNTVPASPNEVPMSYINMADDSMDNIVDTIMNAETNVLYFCNAGKDRTGVVSAIILSKLGYDKAYIINDYLLSGENLKNDLRAFARNNPGVDIDVITPKAEYMEKFLKWFNNKLSIEDTKREFEASFASGVFYDRQTQHAVHLENILRFLDIREGMKILDLGTGSGYLSFAIAKENPGCEIVGLDIVFDALEVNRRKARSEGVNNLSFVSYDGIDFPFEYDTFDMIVTRYALHHFPDIEHCIGEVSRVLKPGGTLFISDPCPNDCDDERFVDDYMRLKKDGHIRFYTKGEWLTICGRHDLKYTDSFDSTIRFPKKKDTAFGYEDVLSRHEKLVIDSYDLVETDTELYITERVNNILFRKLNKTRRTTHDQDSIFRH